jgi:hypothetical protein
LPFANSKSEFRRRLKTSLVITSTRTRFEPGTATGTIKTSDSWRSAFMLRAVSSTLA